MKRKGERLNVKSVFVSKKTLLLIHYIKTNIEVLSEEIIFLNGFTQGYFSKIQKNRKTQVMDKKTMMEQNKFSNFFIRNPN